MVYAPKYLLLRCCSALAKQLRRVQIGPEENLNHVRPPINSTAIFHADGYFCVIRTAYLWIKVEAPYVSIPRTRLPGGKTLKTSIVLKASFKNEQR